MSSGRLIDYGAILTGGAARRMGGSKADLLLGGVMMVELTWRAISSSCGQTICVGGKPYLAHLGVETIPDLFPGADSLGGIGTALSHALNHSGADAWVLCVGCDMPLISPQILSLLASKSEGRDIVVPHVGPGYEPFCALYRAGIYPVVKAHVDAGNLRIRDIFKEVALEVVQAEELRSIDPLLNSFSNINEPVDLEAARSLAAPKPLVAAPDVESVAQRAPEA